MPQVVIDFNLAHRELELAFFDQEIFDMAAQSEGRDASEFINARQRNLVWVNRTLGAALQNHIVLMAPAFMPVWKTDFVLGRSSAGGVITSPAAIGGIPIVTIPMGLVAGLPVELSLVAASLHLASQGLTRTGPMRKSRSGVRKP